ncbi:MAG TPA: antitoxin Xre/MbcA/ParS toxin-binding domain-containing protein [Bacteroidales bacterium]|nr:antitoxin Xre/MbcA/ParS toxin-binding domain-containing protein [Bacteroidales bacterium]
MILEKEQTTEHYKKLKEVLGKKYITDELESPFDFIHIAKKGINANVIKNIRIYFDLPRSIIAEMLNISEPTLYRWTKANKNLEKNYTIKLFEIADLFLYGIDVFESKENFFKWLNLPNTALGGLEPIELIEIPDGISKVRDIIGRFEHGVYS